MHARLSGPLLAMALFFTGTPTAIAGCDDPQTQTEMNICARQDFDAADAELNKVYRKIMAGLEGKHQAALKEAQRAWITYRDLACESFGLLAEGGTMQPMLVSNCLARLTRERTEMINDQSGWN